MYIVLLAIYHLCGIIRPQIDMYLRELNCGLGCQFPKALRILYLLSVFPFDHNYYTIFKVCYKGPLLFSFSGTAGLSESVPCGEIIEARGGSI